MEITLESIDQILGRVNVSYEEAKEALVNSNGDVVEALIYIQNKQKNKFKEVNDRGTELIEKLKNVLRKGNYTRVMLEKDGDILLNLPVTIGALGLVLGPVAAIIGVSAAVASKYKIKIVMEDGSVVDLNEATEEKFNDMKEKIPFMKNKEDKDITDEVVDEVKNENNEDLDK